MTSCMMAERRRYEPNPTFLDRKYSYFFYKDDKITHIQAYRLYTDIIMLYLTDYFSPCTRPCHHKNW